jgi:hypothetical protein
MVLKAFQNIRDQIHCEIEIIVLGAPVGAYGYRTVNQFLKLQDNQVKVKVFNNFVDQEAYNDHMNRSNLLICPLSEFAVFRFYKEYYGKTKTTGSFNDMIKYGIPIILPSYFNADIEMSQYISTYTSQIDLELTLLKYIGDRGFLVKKNKFSTIFYP